MSLESPKQSPKVGSINHIDVVGKLTMVSFMVSSATIASINCANLAEATVVVPITGLKSSLFKEEVENQ